MGIMLPDSISPAPDTSDVRAAVFSERVSELQDLSEMAISIRLVARDVEKGLLGDLAPETDPGFPNDPITERKASDTNLIDELRMLTSLTRDNLQIISDVLNSLGRELGNLGGANKVGTPTPSFREERCGETR